MEQFPDDYECDGQIDIWEWMEEKETQSMTREEAIKKIKSLCHDCVEFPHCVNTDPDCFKALEIAIKALEQEPCEDAVSRKAVDRLAMQYLREPTDKHVAFYEEFIALLPVTPKPKTNVLDKIRAEIEVLEDGISSYHNDRPWIFKDEMLDIIDKYTAESEG